MSPAGALDAQLSRSAGRPERGIPLFETGVSMFRNPGLVLSVALLFWSAGGRAQSSGTTPTSPGATGSSQSVPPDGSAAPGAGPFTIRAESRIVLSDVMVTD